MTGVYMRAAPAFNRLSISWKIDNNNDNNNNNDGNYYIIKTMRRLCYFFKNVKHFNDFS